MHWRKFTSFFTKHTIFFLNFSLFLLFLSTLPKRTKTAATIERPLRRFNLPIDICPKYFAQFYFAHLDICSNEICSKWRGHLLMKTLTQFHVSNYLCHSHSIIYLMVTLLEWYYTNSNKIFQSLASLMIYQVTLEFFNPNQCWYIIFI